MSFTHCISLTCLLIGNYFSFDFFFFPFHVFVDETLSCWLSHILDFACCFSMVVFIVFLYINMFLYIFYKMEVKLEAWSDWLLFGLLLWARGGPVFLCCAVSGDTCLASPLWGCQSDHCLSISQQLWNGDILTSVIPSAFVSWNFSVKKNFSSSILGLPWNTEFTNESG